MSKVLKFNEVNEILFRLLKSTKVLWKLIESKENKKNSYFINIIHNSRKV